MRALLAVVLAALALAPTGAAAESASTRFLHERERPGGGFAEQTGSVGLSLTAWATLGLRASGATPSTATRDYLARAEPAGVPELALLVLARHAVGQPTEPLVARLQRSTRRTGLIGPTLNSTMWGVLALRQVGAPVPRSTKRLLLARQARSGGWAWAAGIAPDSNDTAAAIQALRALGVSGRPIRRGLAYLRARRNRDGGFELAPGRESDSQSTAWAIQAFLAAGERPPRGAFAFLARMRKPDGSYRYSARYPNATPVWVTAQVLPALARRPFPLRP